MSPLQKSIKRTFDFVLALILVPIAILPFCVLWICAMIDTQRNGIFSQVRIGQFGKPFMLYKLRSLRGADHNLGEFHKDASAFGLWLRKSKLDELPQLFNVLIGDMSFVGPRPDLPGFADKLEGDDRIILDMKPGITGPATIKYKNEDALLRAQLNPENYNRTKIWPDKVKINKNYVGNWSFYLDLKYIIHSLVS
ncbi:MAG: sugar transferase [Bacteroidetes bacterium MedPE-SWsnd-G2]|nr:MAG: sugar transferase [Bacteroidetes bacterium MedPE-SWsnd-G2]